MYKWPLYTPYFNVLPMFVTLSAWFTHMCNLAHTPAIRHTPHSIITHLYGYNIDAGMTPYFTGLYGHASDYGVFPMMS